MIFKVEVANQHLTRLAKAMNFTGQQSEFKAFVENQIVEDFKAKVRLSMVNERAEEIQVQDIPDITPAP